MSEVSSLIVAFLVGMPLAVVFFGGLWLTIKKALPSTLAGLWFSGSFLMRTAITLLGFYFITRGDWRRLVSCMAGFLLMRLLIVRLIRAGAPLESTS